MKKVLNEVELRDIIRECINMYLAETAAIRKWTDDDYLKVNPYQEKHGIEDFAKWKEIDDEFNKGKLKDQQVNFAKHKFDTPLSYFQSNIDKVQNEITPNIRQRKIKKTKTSKITTKDVQGHIDSVRKKNSSPIDAMELAKYQHIKDLLAQGGLELEVNGKTFAYGNDKLPEDTMICNVTSTFLCPSAIKGECALVKACYSNKNVEKWPNPFKRNLRNEFAFDYISPKELLKLLYAYIENAPTRISKIRISEDGDLRTQKQLEFIDKIAGHLKAKYDIDTAVYTHRHLDFSKCKNLIINMSDTRQKGGTRYYLAINKAEWKKIPEGLSLYKGKPSFKCHCDCRKCEFCYRTKEGNGENYTEPTRVYDVLRK